MRSETQQPQTRSCRQIPDLAADLAEFGRTVRRLFDPYRPELHYMRGPGPKWRAKHDANRGRVPAVVAATAAHVLASVHG
jgi:hypothetical protein